MPDQLLGELLFPVVSLSVALILLEGGLSLRFRELRESGSVVARLLSIGTACTWLLTTLAAYALLDCSPSLAFLLGAILVVTGPTVVGPLLRQIRPEGKAGAILKWEGIMIDPIGAVLAVLVFEATIAIQSNGLQAAAWEATEGLSRTFVVGGSLATLAAVVLARLFNRYWIPDFLQSPFLLAVALAVFVGANLIQEESGLLAVTLLGVLLSNFKSVTLKHVLEFKENLSILLISVLFVLLAARLQPRDLLLLDWKAAVFVGLLILVVRPAAVFLSTLGTELHWRERLFVAWLAPRGIVAAAVASVFALRLGDAGEMLVPLTFLVIVVTVVVYGLTAGPLAYRLKLADPNPQGFLLASAHPGARAIAETLQTAGVRVLMVDSNRAHTAQARLEGLEAVNASILSEQALEGLDLGGLGRFLALTSNSEVNSLAALHFSQVFGRSEVYQLPPDGLDRSRTGTDTRNLHGRLLFQLDATYEHLDERFARGAAVKKTTLSPEFDYEAFRILHGDNALPLFIGREDGSLTVCTVGQTYKFEPGHTLIALVDAQPEETAAAADLPPP